EPQVTIPALVGAVNDVDEEVRKEAIRSIGRNAQACCSNGSCEQMRETAVRTLLQALKDGSGAVRSVAADSLGEFGDQAGSSVADLTAALRDPVRAVRISAAHALLRIDGAKNRPALQTLVALLS